MSNDAVDFNLLARSGVPTRSFKQGEVIFKQWDSATELYVIQSGRVGIQFGNRLLDTLEEHNIFGEMALIDNSPRSATAVASTDVVLVPVSVEAVLVSR